MLDADRGICTHPGAFQLIVTLIIGAFASGEFVLQQLQTRWPREAEAIVAEAS